MKLSGFDTFFLHLDVDCPPVLDQRSLQAIRPLTTFLKVGMQTFTVCEEEDPFFLEGSAPSENL